MNDFFSYYPNEVSLPKEHTDYYFPSFKQVLTAKHQMDYLSVKTGTKN